MSKFVGKSSYMIEKSSINDYLSRSYETNINLRKLFDAKLDELNFNEHQAMQLLGVDKNSLNPILNGTTKLPSMINVLKLADFLGLKLDEIMPAVLANLPVESIRKLEEANRLSFITKHFDIDNLHKVGFLKSKTDSNHIIGKILNFFGFETIYDYETFESNLNNVAFSKTRRRFSDKIRKFAIDSAYRLFDLIDNPNEYDREQVKRLVEKIRPYSQDVENGIYIVCRTLYNHGLTIVFQNHLANSQYNGATFVWNDKPCIVLTDLNKSYPEIWLALLHELHHVLFDFDTIKSGDGFHLTGEPELMFIDENYADDFARDFFFDRKSYKFIMPHIHDKYMVKAFAKKNQIHESLVYRIFQHYARADKGGNYWVPIKYDPPPIDVVIEKLKPMVWKKDHSLLDIAQELKKIFKLNKNYNETS
jgi:transcriptional regulator with XRE-family HTH domain/Zn-dependent peptidase ImmA (M78 family)